MWNTYTQKSQAVDKKRILKMDLTIGENDQSPKLQRPKQISLKQFPKCLAFFLSFSLKLPIEIRNKTLYLQALF